MATQWILYQMVILPFVSNPALDHWLFFLLSITTGLIASAGYVVNDIYDIESDRKTKPHKVIVGKKILEKSAWMYYFSIILIGGIISTYIAIKTDNLMLLPIYPLAHSILFFYAKHWKKQGYLGNVVVAFMTAFVSIIILIAERKILFENISENKASIIIFFFCIFSFFSNLAREIVKDMEDVDGDVLINSKSMPITLGIEYSKIITLFHQGALALVSVLFGIYFCDNLVKWGLFISMIIIPIIIIAIIINKSKDKKAYHQTSQLMKAHMIAGLVFLIILSKLINE